MQSDGERTLQPQPIELADAYSELQNLLLDGPDVADFLSQLATLAAAVVPGTHCGITLRRDNEVATVAGSDAVALLMDEIQYLRGHGPCLEAMHTGTRVDVPDMVEETRWGDYSAHALASGIRSAVSLPLTLASDTIGALNLFSAASHAFVEADIQRALAFTRQAATALTILVRQVRTLVLDDQLREAIATRATVDQALGMLMVTRKISSTHAFEALRHASQSNNRKISDIAAELIETMTGHPPQPPRPLTERE
ncbi:GAF and ANTAR domain-containing protein [uncultured Jatrophihabitans sp.]|uniref:GAF and ANTAR domain-containing protein n=1 Tax=uncultured Jatrophihabitans sp. TaxID=1610747 RepID=UPI0035C97CF9